MQAVLFMMMHGTPLWTCLLYTSITTQTALDKYCNNCEIFLGKPVVYEKKSADESEAAEGFRLEEKVELNGKTLYILPEETFKKDVYKRQVQDREQEVYGCLKMVLDIRMPEWHQKMK